MCPRRCKAAIFTTSSKDNPLTVSVYNISNVLCICIRSTVWPRPYFQREWVVEGGKQDIEGTDGEVTVGCQQKSRMMMLPLDFIQGCQALPFSYGCTSNF